MWILSALSGRDNMGKNKLLKIMMGVVVLIFLGLILSVVNGFYGNPLSATIATNRIRAYVNDQYPDMDLEVSKAKYNFKFSEYYSRVESKTSQDTNFSVGWSKGRIDDDYEYEVKNHFTTYRRLQEELDHTVQEILEREFPYETSIEFMDFSKESDFSLLQLDMSIDMSNPPLPTTLTVYILSKDINYDILVERMRELADIMDKNEIHVDYYSIVLEQPLKEGEEKPAPDGERLYLYDFPADNMQQQNLIGLIKQHQSDWEENHTK
jgi:hypothetical protein